MFMVQSGTSLASTLVLLNGTPCASEGTLTGTVDQQAVDLTIRETDGPDRTGSTDGVTISGSYSICGACDGGDTGTFVADFIPSVDSSRWSGDTSSINGTADLQDDSRGLLGLERASAEDSTFSMTRHCFYTMVPLTNSWPSLGEPLQSVKVMRSESRYLGISPAQIPALSEKLLFLFFQ